MKNRIFYLILMILIVPYYIQIKSAGEDEFLEVLRNKIRHLENTNQINRNYEPYKHFEATDNEEYDFIIVGTGSSGSAVINRLSEIKEWKILVLEAGGEPDILSDIPLWSPLTIDGTDIVWHYFTEKEENLGLAVEDQRMHWPRGKVLGGSSTINYMLHTRAPKEDYNTWADLGNPGWSYDDLLPLFKKMEISKVEISDTEFRGDSGPIHVEDPYRTKAAETFLEAALNAGYKYLDYNGEGHLGVSYTQSTTKNGLRCSGESCYIRPIKNRENLIIRLHSHVTKVIITDTTARGVEYIKDGKTYKAYANKEVVLSAGVLSSPQILMLSGIGPKEQLQNFGIAPIVDLLVGQKMYDHPSYWGLGFTVNESIGYNFDQASKEEAFKKLYNAEYGVLSSAGAVENIILTKTPFASGTSADIEFLFQSLHFSNSPDRGFTKLLRISKDFYNKMYKEYESQNTISCFVVLMHPQSTGRLELRSNDPFEYPKLYSGFFTDANAIDIKVMIVGIREAIRVMLSPPFDKYDIKLMDKPMVGCENFVYDSDEYWECALRHMTTPIFHHTTTCKMGPANDREAVVDNRLRVYGINNLRIADTSIIPIQLAGHTNVPAFLVGEKAAEIIKEEHLI